MSNAQKIVDHLRDLARRKATVYIKNKSPDGTGFKLVPGVVVDVMRGAARIKRDGVPTPTVVRFADIEFEQPVERARETPVLPANAPVGERKWPLGVEVGSAKPLALVPRPADVRQPDPEVEQVTGSESQIDAWLAMGRELQADLKNELLTLDDQRDLLVAEREAIERELDQIAERKKLLSANLARLSGGKG